MSSFPLNVVAFLVFVIAVEANVALLNKLLDPSVYNRRVLPADNSTGRVKVTVDLFIERIHGLKDREEELAWTGYVVVTWNNPFLSWDPAKWGGTEKINLLEEDMWIPDISIIERLNGEIGFNNQKRRGLAVWPNGDVEWVLGGDIITTRCILNVRKFPFDSQSCTMLVGSYVLDSSQITLISGNNSQWDGIGGNNSIWEVTGWDSQIVNTDDGNPPHTLDFLFFTIHLRRLSSYYVVNVLLPCFLTSLVMGMVFLLPVDGGEKIGFAITLLLAFNVMQIVISDNIPKTSEHIPIISIYVCGLLGLSTATIPLAVLVIYVGSNGLNLPNFITRLAKRASGGNSQFTDSTEGLASATKTSQNENEATNDFTRYKTQISKSDEKEKFKKMAQKLDNFFLLVFNVTLIVLSLTCWILVQE